MKEIKARTFIRKAGRVCVKAGTSVVANENGRPSLTRLGAIIEQISELHEQGKEVIFVSSGAVGMGKRLLKKQEKMSMMTINDMHSENARNIAEKGKEMKSKSSFIDMLNSSELPHTYMEKSKHYDSACAAAGQFEMMNLYCSLFSQYDISASQILVTQSDFTDPQRLQNLCYALERLLERGIVPIINENDAVSANTGYTPDNVFSDNDSLAALCARSFQADVLLLLTDVEGVFDKPPSEEGAQKLDVYVQESSKVAIGVKSNQGRGGMASKIEAATGAVAPGSSCGACVVASGADLNSIRAIFGPKHQFEAKGTLFLTPGSPSEMQAIQELNAEKNDTSLTDEAREKACKAREEARKLQSLPHQVRKNILESMASALVAKQDIILAANVLDMEEAAKNDLSLVLKKRLHLTEEKLSTLALGLRQLASLDDPLGVVKCKRELSKGLVLSQITVPIGVLMIIFESRPDSLPQISALSLVSGNGLLLKGGKEAFHSNTALHNVLGDAIESGSNGEIGREIIALITSRAQVSDMLALDDVIDLVIPRGSNDLVSYIKANTRIPVLGHADGVCHLYVDSSADADTAVKIIIDAKTDYPSACNAMETLLLHRDTLENDCASKILVSLRSNGVKCLGGPSAMKAGLADIAAQHFKKEYGDLTCMVEVVESMDAAIDWIHKHGSGHTETIVCGVNDAVGEEFLRRVDAACVFKNCSSRFSDGFRFGLGAEVGISTGRIHARGPVGVEGLLTTKWQLRSQDADIVAEFAGENAPKQYTHFDLM